MVETRIAVSEVFEILGSGTKCAPAKRGAPPAAVRQAGSIAPADTGSGRTITVVATG